MPTVLVTGANRGIGLELARQYRGAGWRVIGCCRRPESAEALTAVLGGEPIRTLDVTRPADIERLATDLRGVAIDLLVNNAGVLTPPDQSLALHDHAAWVTSFETNAIGPFLVTRALVPNLMAGSRKVVATLSSRMGSVADNNSGGYYAYRSSKAALNAVMRSLALDLRERGIVVTLFHPGWVRTEMGGPAALLEPREAVATLRETIGRITLRDSGRFLNLDGSELPW